MNRDKRGRTVTLLLVIDVIVPVAMADANEIRCETSGNYTHCYDANTGQLLSTTEKGAGDTSHTWTPGPNGRSWTTQGTHTWETTPKTTGE
jgi:hypothetical protein